MASLAIKGHATRGKEVIEILEMLGGINSEHFNGDGTTLFYFIKPDNSIRAIGNDIDYGTVFHKMTLEEFLVKFPYKVGDRVRLKSKPNYIYTVHSLTWDDNKQLAYRFLPSNDKHLIVISLNAQDQYELLPNKFDITTLKPFSEVLVRQNVYGKWEIDFFGYYNRGDHHTTGACIFKQCIPYAGNEYLLGTTDDCDEYYKTWK